MPATAPTTSSPGWNCRMDSSAPTSPCARSAARSALTPRAYPDVVTRTGEVDDAPDQGGAEELAVHAPIHLTRSSAPWTSTGSPASPVEVQERHCPAAAEGRT